MRLVLLILCTMGVIMATGCANKVTLHKRVYEGGDGTSLKYVLYVPEKMEADEPVPLLLYLHGSCGECVTHERIMKESNLQLWHCYEKMTQLEPTILVAPAGGRGGWTRNGRAEALFGIVDGLIEEFPVDRQRIYIQGFSMGGGGTWSLIQQRPGFFAAANPQASPGRGVDPQAVKDTPIWATIGANDEASRVEGMKGNVAAIRAANGDDRGPLLEVTGVNPRLSIFPGTTHGGAQGETQKIPGFREWMYSHVNDGNAAPNVWFVEPKMVGATKDPDRTPVTPTVKAVVAAMDAEDELAKVEFYVGDKLVATDEAAPYGHTFRDLPDGEQVLKAKAIDAGGKSRTAELAVTVYVMEL